MTLNELETGETVIVRTVGGTGELRQHFLDMGIIHGAKITLSKIAPMGDPLEFRIHNYELTLRKADAEKICGEKLVSSEKTEKPCTSDKSEKSGDLNKSKTGIHHPGLGEAGKYHVKADEHPLPAGTKLSFALAGNQNCGKTTLFNQLTGSNQHVGNFPGVTVDQKSGSIRGHSETQITDLPGIYSLSPYTAEEIVTREFILNQKPTCIINIVDATNIQRNLYLTLQLMELEVPVVLALNMMDEVYNNGGSIRINEMENLLGIPVVPISASKNQGIEELVSHALHIAQFQEKPGRTDFCDKDGEDGGAIHRCLHAIMHLIFDHAEYAGIPLRFAACKLVEGDERVTSALNLCQNELDMIEHIIVQMEEECGLDRAAAMAAMRFRFINKVCDETVVQPKESREHERSTKIDRILTGKWTAIPSFIAIMGLVFFLTFNVVGAWLQTLLAAGIGWLTSVVDSALFNMHVNATLHSLVIDGIFNGVGSVVSFVPVIVVLFFFLSMLEDSGYLARVAFVMDKLLRKLGLSGRSIVPMLIGFGCTVPGVMSSRTLPSDRDRKMTIMLTPFMSCSAKLPIYGFLCSTFFPDYAGLVMIGIYLLGIVVGIIVAIISKSTVFRGEAVPFVMELPNYRLPGLKNVLHLLWEKARDFLQKAFTLILIATVVIWFLQTFDFRLNLVTDSADSMLAIIAGFIAPVFAPLGFGDWRIVTALITGFMAKESVVSTLTVLLGSSAAATATAGTAASSAVGITSVLSPSAAFSLLVFCLLYTPCIAAIAAVKRELGRKWAWIMVIGQCAIAWVFAFLFKIIF